MQPATDRLWNSNYWKVMTTNFTLSFSFYLLTPLLPLYLSETFGSSKDMIGLVLSGYTITALIVRPFSGFFVDSFSRKRVLLISLFIYFICFSGYLLAGTLLLFAIVRTLHGAPFGASTVANSTMAIDVLPSSRRNEGIGYYGLSNNLATAIAPTVGVFIYRYAHNFDLLFWLAFLVAGIGLAVDATLKPPPRPLQTGKRPISLDRFFLVRGWLIGLDMAFFGVCFGVLSNYLAIYGKETMGITSGTGTFFMLLSIGLILSRLQGGKMLRQGRLTYNAAIGIITSTIGYLLFVACPNMAGYYGAAILIGLGNGHLWPAFQNMIIGVATNNQRGTANSTLLTSWDLGIGIGILLGGSIVEYLGYAAAFWWIAIMHFAGALLFFLATRSFFLRNRIVR
ncbi:MAG: MFS transporter [Bacteroidales bacterium]|nr:MFS transporter [Bacteroidales bacterium]MBR5715773.1 MFS transporter [Bacteroidales bacterium]